MVSMHFNPVYFFSNKFNGMEQKVMTFDHDFYVVIGNLAYAGHQHNIFI